MNQIRKKYETVVLTTAFDISLEIARQFFRSLLNQSNNNFDIFIVNDGFGEMGVIRSEFPTLNIIEVEGVGVIAKNREILINSTRNLYKHLIFSDFDDFFESNRIDVCLDLLKYHDLVVNDLHLYQSGILTDKSIFSESLANRQCIFIDDILQCNYFGMSNTAVNTKIIPSVEFDSRLLAVDWYFYSLLLLKGVDAVFSSETATIYRQYAHNIANISSKCMEQLRKEFQVKYIHYEILSNRSNLHSILLDRLKEVGEIINATNSDCSIDQFNFYDASDKSWWSLINLNIGG